MAIASQYILQKIIFTKAQLMHIDNVYKQFNIPSAYCRIFLTFLLLCSTKSFIIMYFSASEVKYRIAGLCCEDFNLAIGSIRGIKIRGHFNRDILYLALY